LALVEEGQRSGSPPDSPGPSNTALVIGGRLRRMPALAGKRRKEATMSLRSVLALALLIWLQLAACTTAGKPSPSIGDVERRHDEMMRGIGGGSGGGGGSGM